ncbi:MAG: ROK family protein [Methylotenera sp.]
MALTIGIDVGGTNIRFGVFEGKKLVEITRLEVNIGGVCRALTFETAPVEVIRILFTEIHALQKKYLAIQAVGVGFPGFIDPTTKKIMQSPNLPHLKDFDLSAQLSKAINLPVALENDANAAAFGEYSLAGKPEGGLIYMGLGTGVGGGLILDSKIVSGQHGCAMEVGHIIVESNGRQCGCGNKGCMEAYASATGVAISYFNAIQKQLTAHQIAELAHKGDKAAIEAYELAANALAQALASILKVVDAQTVVIGGGMSGAWLLMKSAFDARFEADLIPVLRDKITVKISTTNDTAGMLGAAMLSSAKLTLA